MKKAILPFLFCVFFGCQENELTLENIEETNDAFQMKPDEYGVYTLKNGMKVIKEDYYYIYQDDILLSESQVSIINSNLVTRGTYTSDWNLHWGKGTNNYTIPYTIDNSILQRPGSTTAILAALTHISDRTNVSFRPSTNSDSDYIIFRYHDDKNSSAIGRQGGGQIINLFNYDFMGTVIHEVCHALGLLHEQSRYDRNEYIVVHYDNIAKSNRHNFDRDPDSRISSPFDFNSIMMYSSKSFAINSDLPTITKLDGSEYSTQRYSLSSGDISAINRFYYEPKHVISGKTHISPNQIESYTLSKVPSDATVTWSLSNPNTGTILSGQGTNNVQIKFNQPTEGAISATIKHNSGYIRHIPGLLYTVSNNPMIENIDMFKYFQSSGEHTLYAKITNYPDSNIEWFSDGDAIFYEHPYSYDAIFSLTPNLYTAVDFYSHRDYMISVTARHPSTHESYYSQIVTPEDIKSNFPFQLSPNPMKAGEIVEVNIEKESNKSLKAEIFDISIFDKNKDLVYKTTKAGFNFNLDLSSLSNGIYYVIAKDNGRTYSTKIQIK